MIRLMMINSKLINLIIIDMMTLIERLIKMLIELLIAVEKFVVERLVIELIEKFLTELICMHVDIFEINLIAIKILINVGGGRGRALFH